MKLIIAGNDGQLTGQVMQTLQRVDAGLHCHLLAPAAPVPPCALFVHVACAHEDAADAPRPEAAAVRWYIHPEAAGAEPLMGFDTVLPWPAAQEQLLHALRQAAHLVRARHGLARPEVLQQALYRVVELASESIEVVDPSIRLLYANPAFEQVTGWAMEDAVGFTTGELFRAGTHDPAYYAEIGAALREGKVWRGPLVARRRDGVLSFQEATLSPVKNDNGATIAFVAIKRDAERDSMAHSTGESSGKRLQTMIEDAADAFLVHDAQGRIVDANARAAHMLGRERGALLGGSRVQDFLPSADAARMDAVLADLQPGEPRTLETQFMVPGAAALPVGLRVGAFSFGGERFVLTLARDISERITLETALRRQSEELSQSLRTLQATQRELVQREKHAALGTLVAGVAHDVNTPLGVTMTALTLAQDHLREVDAALANPRPSRQSVRDHLKGLHDALEVGLHNARRAAQLIADFKKIAVDQASEVLRNVEMVGYLRSVVANFGPALRRARIKVSVTGAEVDVMTRPGAIAQAVTNLLQNAMVHAFDTEHTNKRIEISVSHDAQDVRLSVRDNGKGMTAEVAARAFDPFFTTRMGAGGSGLGMTIVHNLVVEVLGGGITLQTEPGAGLTVRITVPRDAPRPPPGTAASDATPSDPASSHSLRELQT